MKTRLSHSAVQKFQACGVAYDYHYNKRIRSRYHSAALAFGSAIDAGLNELLVPTGKTPEEVFEKHFNHTEINGAYTFLPTCVDIVYQNNDFDVDLLTKDDYKALETKAKAGFWVGYDDYLEAYEAIKKRKSTKGFDSLVGADKMLFNFMNWLCMRRKGMLMIDAYRRKVLPKLTKIHEVQRKVSLKNTDGDEVVGYVDLIADVEGIGTVILDNKTSTIAYDDDVVLTSPQLSLYVHMLEEEYKTRKGGFIVMRKSISKNRKKTCMSCGYDGSGGRHKSCDNIVLGKRCGGQWHEEIDPDVYIQFIVDEIPRQTEEIVISNFDETNKAIKAGNYTRNFNSCHNSFGSKCIYFNLCYKNKMDGLTDLKINGEDI